MNNFVVRTLNALANICLLRASPVALPFSPMMLIAMVMTDLLFKVHTLIVQLNDVDVVEVTLGIVLSLLVLIGLIYFILAKRKLKSRFHKLLLAWFGTEILLTGVLKIVLALISQAQTEIQIGVEMGFLIWNLVVKAQILRVSMDIRYFSALMLTFGILVAASLPIQIALSPYMEQLEPQSDQQTEPAPQT
jgi:hypothetical protein